MVSIGKINSAFEGCACPMGVLSREFLKKLWLPEKTIAIIDMEAGIEHLGRATAKAVDKLIVVVEPGRRSIDTAEHIRKLAGEIGLHHIAVVGVDVGIQRSRIDENSYRPTSAARISSIRSEISSRPLRPTPAARRRRCWPPR